MTSYVAGVAITATAGAGISAISNIVSLVSTVKKLTTSEEVKEAIDDLDIEATVSTIELVCKTHIDGGSDFMLARDFVVKALNKVKFDLETIHVKTKLHKEGYISRWRSLDVTKERRKLARSVKILRSRFRLMWTIAQGPSKKEFINTYDLLYT
jgi:hypothetical protein